MRSFGIVGSKEQPEQQRLAEASKAALDSSGWFDREIVTGIAPAGQFTVEDYHQDYYKRKPPQYQVLPLQLRP